MQPLRNVIQTLARIAYVDLRQNSNAYAHEFGQAMIAMSLQNLYQANIPVDELVAENFNALTETVFEIAMDDGDPDTSAYLRPTSAQVHNRSAMFGLSAAVAQQLRGKPGTCLTYLLRGPGMVKLMHVAIVSSKRSLEDEVLKREFRRYMGPGRRDDALGWSRLASTVFVAKYVSSPTNSMNHYGIIGLKQKGRNDTNTSFKVIFNKLAKDNNQYPASVFSLVNLSASGTKTLASIYNILGLMGKLLSMTEKSDWKTSNESDKKNNILNELLGFYPNTNSVTQPVWVTSQEDIVDDDERDKTLLDEKKLSIENWLEPLHLWLNNAVILNQYIAPSSVMIGKLIPRLFYGLENISTALRTKTKTYQTDFASSMELFALCVVNAFLAEESAFHLIESYGSKRIFLANPRTSAADYLQRLNKEFPKNSISKERLPLTFIVATCPLITGLISKKKAENNWPFSISDTDSTERGSNFIGESDWTYLSKISIAGKKESAAQNEKNKNNGKTEPPPSDTSTPGSE